MLFLCLLLTRFFVISMILCFLQYHEQYIAHVFVLGANCVTLNNNWTHSQSNSNSLCKACLSLFCMLCMYTQEKTERLYALHSELSSGLLALANPVFLCYLGSVSNTLYYQLSIVDKFILPKKFPVSMYYESMMMVYRSVSESHNYY